MMGLKLNHVSKIGPWSKEHCQPSADTVCFVVRSGRYIGFIVLCIGHLGIHKAGLKITWYNTQHINCQQRTYLSLKLVIAREVPYLIMMGPDCISWLPLHKLLTVNPISADNIQNTFLWKGNYILVAHLIQNYFYPIHIKFKNTLWMQHVKWHMLLSDSIGNSHIYLLKWHCKWSI